MSTEKLHVKIGMSGTFWGRRPVYSMLLNEHKIIDSRAIAEATDVVEYVEFDVELTEGTEYKLFIRLENKINSDVVQNEDKTAIINDMLLNIVSIEIDEINLGNLINTQSRFVGDDAARPVLVQCTNLGWNGTWELSFTSPFYVWLLENI